MGLSPEELRGKLQGLFSFPVTPFTESLEIDLARYREHVGWMVEGKPAALFVCGGTGEFFSLDLTEFRSLVKAAVEVAGGRLPVIAGAGYGTQLALSFVKAAEEAGADGLLIEVHPHPDKALSDGAQSMFPDKFAELMETLRIIAPAVGRTI